MLEQEEDNPLSQEVEKEGVHTAQGQEGAGDGPRTHTAYMPIPEEGRDPPVRYRVLPAHGIPEQEEGNPPG